MTDTPGLSGTRDFQMNLAFLIGRILIFFGSIPNGIRKITDFESISAMMGGAPVQMINGRPFPSSEPLFYFPFPEFFLSVGVFMDITAAALVIIGLWTRPVALAFAIYCITAMTIYHPNILSVPGDLQAVIRTLPLVGGVLLLSGAGAGQWSLDGWLARKRRQH